jgi:hypothetical protein
MERVSVGKRGPQPGSAKKGATTSIRFEPGLKKRLAAAAKRNGVTFSEEVSQRLELSFSTLATREAEFGDRSTYAFCRFLARAFQKVREETGYHWTGHPFAFKHAKQAVEELLDLMSPPGTLQVPDDMPVLMTLRSHHGPKVDLSNLIELMAAAQIGSIAAERTIREMENSEDDQLKGIADELKRRLRTMHRKVDDG